MNTRIYNKIAKREDKAKLISKVLKYIGEKEKTLSKKQLELIAKYTYSKSTDYIKVITDAKEFSDEITLKDYDFTHSWAGCETEKDEAEIIFGNCSFGLKYDREYSNNGNMENGDHEYKECNFNIEDTICIYKHNNSFSNYNNDYYDNDKYSIVIYFGSNDSYKIDPEIQYILNNFDI